MSGSTRHNLNSNIPTAIGASLLGVLAYMYVTDRAQNTGEPLALRRSIQGVRDQVQDVRNEVQDVRDKVQVAKDEVREVKVAVARVEERLQFLIQQA